MKSTTIESFEDYLSYTSEFPREGRVFRGVSDSVYRLIPKVGRPQFRETYSHKSEKHLLKLFKQRAYAFITRPLTSDLEWMALAQHHGLPTRLLDWTVNPLVGMFFAVQGSSDTDAAVYTTHFPRGRSNFDPFKLDRPRKYYPPHMSPRITAQEGLFVVQDPTKALEEQYSRSAIERILIPAGKRFELLLRLDQLGFNHERMFPGLDGAATLLEWRFGNNIGKWHSG